MKENLGKIVVILLMIAFVFSDRIVDWFSDLNPFDYARITAVEYKAEVVDKPFSQGKVIITERLTFDIHAASNNNLFWELWRDLPEEYIDGVKVEYKVNSVKQILDNGRHLVYDEAHELYWFDEDYIDTNGGKGPGKWFHSKGPYDGEYNFECVLFYVDGLYRETVVFEIEYEMYNAALRYKDYSELYISLYSGNTIKYLKSFKGEILFPDDKMPSSNNYVAYTYGTNSHEFPFIESNSLHPGYHTFSFELNETDLKFKPYNQYIEFALLAYNDDAHVFTEYASYNNHSKDDMLELANKAQHDYEMLPTVYRNIKLTVIAILLLASGVIIGSILTFEEKFKKKYKFYKPSREIDLYRSIPSDLDANFAAILVFCKHKERDDVDDGYATAMLSLVHKKYIEIVKINNDRDWTETNTKIIIKYHPANPQLNETDKEVHHDIDEKTLDLKALTPTEEKYFSLIKRHTVLNEITLDAFQKKIASDYSHTNSFIKNLKNTIKNIGLTNGYFAEADYKKPRNELKKKSNSYGIIGITFIILVNYISYKTRLDFVFGGFFILGIAYMYGAFHYNKLSKKYVLLSQFGEDEYAKWRGLYKFLNSETLMKEKTVLEVSLWEEYLIYATAFGIAEKVIKALEIRCPEMNYSNSPVLYNTYFRSSHFHSNSRSFQSATRTATHTSRSGGYGGYGGGGRGGGGGGGGH